MSRQKIVFFVVFIFLLLSTLSAFPVPAYSQEEVNLNVANTYEVEDAENVKDGDIIAINEQSGKLMRAQAGQEGMKIFGVAVKQPPIVFRSSDTGVPIVRGGEVRVNVVNTGGPIKVGDLVTLSAVLGKGQKATQADVPVVGLALESFDAQEFEGKIKVALRVGSGFKQGEELQRIASLYLKQLGLSALDVFSGKEGVQLTFRYVLAAVVVIFSVFTSFRFFGQQILKGIDSMGRNPLASRKIQTIIVLNAVLIALVNLGAIVLALFIVRF